MAKRSEEREEREEREHERRGGAAHEKRAEGGSAHTTRMEMDRPEDKRGGGVRRPRRAKGGKAGTKVNEYNAKGSPEMRDVEDETDGFAKGGHAKRKDGGMAHGEHGMERADRAPRGRARRAAGGGVWSSGSKLERPKDGDAASRGHEGQKVDPEPGPA